MFCWNPTHNLQVTLQAFLYSHVLSHANPQVMSVARAAGWQRTEPLVWIVSQAFRCMGSSNICELAFQRLRSKEKKGSNDNCKLSSPSQWARLIDSKVSAT